MMKRRLGSFLKSLKSEDLVKTKIICTIGPACTSKQILKEMALSGMNAARLNFSHGTQEAHAQNIKTIRKLALEIEKPIAIIQDLPGSKIRIGQLPSPIKLLEGTPFTLTTREIEGNSHEAPLTLNKIPIGIKRGDYIFLADGFIRLQITSLNTTDIACKVLVGGELTTGKSVNIPGLHLDIPPITKTDHDHLIFGLKHGVDFIAFSFLTSIKDVIEARNLIESHGEASLIVKIEKREALQHIDDIIKISDGIMIARGDLGVEIPIEEVANTQKNIITKCNQRGKFVITATQMLVSMVNHYLPSRAEVTDVANAIIDGTDVVMLSEETAIGKYPVESVKMLTKIATITEANLPYQQILNSQSNSLSHTREDALSFATAKIAIDTNARMIISPTRSGLTACRISKYRPPTPIIALTPHIKTAMKLTLKWGVFPVMTRILKTVDLMFKEATQTVITLGLAKKEDTIIIVAGDPKTPHSTTELLKIQKLR